MGTVRYLFMPKYREKKMKKVVIALVSLILIAAGIGCSTSLSYLITPADKDQDAVNYAVEAGVAEPNEYKGYFNLDKAIKLMKDVSIAYTIRKQKLVQALEREETTHSILSETTKANRDVALEREEALFGPTGILSVGLTLAGISGAGVLGLMRKRPGDVTPQEMQNVLAEATGRKQEELTVKEKQFTQLVKGVQTFVNKQKNGGSSIKETLANLKAAAVESGNVEAVKVIDELVGYADTWNGDVILSLKAAMDKYQDTDTKLEVQKVKKELV